MAILNRIRKLRVESDNLSQARLAKQIDVSRQALNDIERGQRLPSLEVAHRIADALDRSLDDVFHYESELPTEDDDDGQMTIIVYIDDDPEWWKSDDVSHVTTSAKRCSDAAH
jgi:putative transcriptional regulator